MANTYYDSQLTAEEIEEVLEAVNGILTQANNGKVLAISNGKIEARSVQWGSGEAVLEPLSVTENGDYYPEAGVDGFDEVHVSVPNSYSASDEGKVVSNGALVEQTARSSQITQNGTYDTTLNNEVTVNVSGGGSAVVQPLSVTQNGTYNPPSGVDGYAPVTVNVPSGGSVVPEGYTELPYIESSGTQYIDTGVSGQGGVKVRGTLCFVTTVDQYDTICGSQASGGTTERNAQIMRYARTDSYACWSGSKYADTGLTIVYDDLVDITCDNRNFVVALIQETATVTGVYASGASDSRSSNNLFLFALNDGGIAGYFSAAKIKHLEIIDTTGTKVRDFYAAKRNSDNELGLWDVVTNNFYTNQGTGTFITE